MEEKEDATPTHANCFEDVSGLPALRTQRGGPALPVLQRSSDEMAQLLTLVLDHLDYPLLLVEGRRVVHRNRAAFKRLAQPGCVLSIERGVLHSADAGCTDRLQRALGSACERGHQQMVQLEPARRAQAPVDSVAASVAIIPLAAQQAGTRMALVVLARTQLCSLLAAHWFCAANQLTQAESNVLRDLVNGLDASAIARRNQVALSTVRTQIAHVRNKTQARGIRDLLAVVAKLPPLAAAV